MTVRWDAAPDEGVRIVWQEIGGPPVTPPARSGFGSTLLGRALFPPPHVVDHIFAPEGVICTIALKPT